MKINIDKETALKYFNHLKFINGWRVEEYDMKECLRDEEVFNQILPEVKTMIDEIERTLPKKRIDKIESSLSERLTHREFHEADRGDVIMRQEISSEHDEMEPKNPAEFELDSIIQKMEEIKAKYPGKKVYLSMSADGTMALEDITLFATVKKMHPLSDIYLDVFRVIKWEIDKHERDLVELKEKQKELGL